MTVLDGSIANVALPTLAEALHVSPGTSIWIVSGYQLALIVSLLPFAALGESIGYRRVFAGGLVAFTMASAFCALAPNLPTLVAARAFQGLGGAASMAVLAALLRFTYPAPMLGTAIGWNATAVALSAAAGPSLGVAVLSLAGWPWLFAVNIPIGILAFVASSALPEAEPHHRPVDGVGVLLNGLVFGALVLGVGRLVDAPWSAVALIAIAVASLALLVRRDAGKTAPLIPLDLLGRAPIRASAAASICMFAAQALALVGLPFHIQHGLGADALTTGLLMTPWPIASAVAAPLAGRLSATVPAGTLCAMGGGGLALGLGLAAAWPTSDTEAPLIAFTLLGGLGFGLFQPPNNRVMVLSAPRERSGAVGGLQATARLLGQTNGAVVVAALFRVAGGDAPRIALALGAALAALAGLISVFRADGRGRQAT